MRVSVSGASAPTMREVGAQAGVSVMTVSRALHDDPRVSPQTRDRVLAAARDLGYRRNELARSLRLGSPSGIMGLIVTNLANPFYSQLALGVEGAAAERGMMVVLSNTGADVERERQIVHDLAARRLDGLIVVPTGEDQSHLDPASLNDIPVVLVTKPPIGVAVDCVLLDDFGGATKATSGLLSAGHSRVGFLGPPAAWTSEERIRGFRAAMQGAGIDLDEGLIRCQQREVSAAEHAAQALLSLPNPPTALFCANSRNAIGAYRAVRRMQRDTALSSFDDFELADLLNLTVVAYDPAALGRIAAGLLLDRLAGTTSPPRRVILPTTIVDYTSNGLNASTG